MGTNELISNKELIVGLLRASASIEEKLNLALKPYELSLPQFNVLRILRGNQSHPVTLATLQAKMIKPMSNTTRLVDKLLNKNLVSREICALNRRKVDICITQKGLELLTDLDRSIATAEKEILNPMNRSQREHLHSILKSLLQEKN